MAMFWDFGSAVSSHRQAAGDHVQPAETRSNRRVRSSSEHREIALPCFGFRHIAQVDFGEERTDKKNTYEIIRGNNIRVGAERFRCAELATNLYRTS